PSQPNLWQKCGPCPPSASATPRSRAGLIDGQGTAGSALGLRPGDGRGRGRDIDADVELIVGWLSRVGHGAFPSLLCWQLGTTDSRQANGDPRPATVYARDSWSRPHHAVQ